MGRIFIGNVKGVGISAIYKQYYASTSSSSLVGGEWVDDVPTIEDGKYLWSRWRAELTDNTVEMTEAVQEGIAGTELTAITNLLGILAPEGTIESARQNINFIGRNPIASLEDDTTANWVALGTGVAYYNSTYITDQPATNGFLENKVYGNVVHQTFYRRGDNGKTWVRSGTSSGWESSWIEQLNEETGIQIKKLWENASPGSSFAAQTISLDLTEYDEVEIEFRTTTSSSFYWITTIKKNRNGQLIAFAQQGTDGANTLMLSRQVVVSASSITFRDTEQKNLNTKAVSTSNTSGVPTKVWAIKGVQ